MLNSTRVVTAKNPRKTGQEGEALKITGGNPELGGQVRAVSRESAHALVSQGVQQVQEGDEEQGDAQKQQIIIGDKAPGIPGQGKDPAGNDDAENFGDAVEEEIAIEAGQVQGQKQKSPEENGQDERQIRRRLSHPCC